MPVVGEVFRKFKIVSKVGEGGMGEVYRAEDTRLGRSVALKFLNWVTTAEPGMADRMLLEARSLARLDHPNIVTLLDFDEADGLPYLVLEWIDGESLDRWSAGRSYDEAAFLAVASPIAEGLAAAHKRGVVHRDLKPANVLVARDGRIKLVDFGLAKFREGGPNLTRSSTVLGTAPYMSPEQANGAPVGATSDVFSFGSLAYELLTGETPFRRDSLPATLYAIVHEPHTPLASRRPDLSASLVEWVESCLRKDPDERPKDGGAIAQAIRPHAPDISRMATTPIPVPPRRRVPASAPVPRAPELRYCTTRDGASIAYTVHGSGPMLVRVLGWYTHLELEWEWPALRQIWERLGEHYTLVRYDGRGFGMSPEWPGAFTEETREADLIAVLDAVGAERPTLFGISEGVWTAWSFAYAHRERLSHLILYGGYGRAGRFMPNYDLEESDAWIVLMRKAWGSESPGFRQIFSENYFGQDADPNLVRHFNHLQWAAADGDTAARYLKSLRLRDDGTERLKTLTTPTLVIHGRDDRVTPFEEGVRLASLIPGARMLSLPTATHYFPTGDDTTERIVEAIREFVPENES
jgi:pimeloyl-ACP methyl ester carboxylesterase/predicted Ser/Thr protein kinase